MSLLLLPAIGFCSLAALPPQPAPPSAPAGAPVVRDFELNPPGGAVAVRYRPASPGPGRAVLVIGANAHPLDETDPLASGLQQRGYSVLVMDYPSHFRRDAAPGEAPMLNPYAMRNSSLPSAMRDASAGLAFLSKDPGARATDVLLVGIGLGANLAAMLAARDPRVVALVLLDPGGSCDPTIARSALDSVRGRPALLVARSADSDFNRMFLSANDPLRTSVNADEPDATGRVAGIGELPRLDRVIPWILDVCPPAPH